MARNIRSTKLYHSLNADWRQRCRSRIWRGRVESFLRSNSEPSLAILTSQETIDLIDELGNENGKRYLSLAKRRTIGSIVDHAAHNEAALQLSLRAVFNSVDCYWWPLKFGDHEAELALAELMMFAFIELSDASKVGSQRQDPLACVRTNATNRAVSSLNTQRKRCSKSDLVPFDVLEASCHTEEFVHELGQSLQQMTQDLVAASGESAASVASFVFHQVFGLSFKELSLVSTRSKATHHRQARRVEQALQVEAA